VGKSTTAQGNRGNLVSKRSIKGKRKRKTVITRERGIDKRGVGCRARNIQMPKSRKKTRELEKEKPFVEGGGSLGAISPENRKVNLQW